MHLNKLIAKTDEILAKETPPNQTELVSLENLLHQIRAKEEVLSALDQRILNAIETEEDLEAEVIESEDLKSDLSEKIFQTSKFLESSLHSAVPPL